MERFHLANPLPRERSHHSFVNAVHVVHVQLQLLERITGSRGAFRRDIVLCDEATSASRTRRLEPPDVPIERFGSIILEDVYTATSDMVDGVDRGEALEIVDILAKGLLITEVRLQELLFDLGSDLDRGWWSVDSFVREVQRTLAVLCLDRRWNIVYSKDDHDERGYLVELAVTSRTGDNVEVPTVLARMLAYVVHAALQRTKPGGRVALALVDEPDGVSATVRDNGRPVQIDGINERLRRLVETGDPQADGLQAMDAPLAMAAALAARAGGAAAVETSPGSETAIRISLPQRGGE
jgi:hypothetical protein